MLNREKNSQPSYFFEAIIASFTLLALGIYILWGIIKNEEDWNKVTGTVASYDKVDYGNYLPFYEDSKNRYLSITGYPKVFKIRFRESSDHTYFILDNIKIGDKISVYYDIPPFSNSETRLNHFVKLIYKDNKIYYKSDSFYSLITGIIFISISSFFILLMIYLKNKGKII